MENYKSTSLIAGSVLAAGLLGGINGALAYDTGDLIVRAGIASVQPDEDSSKLEIEGVGKLPGTGAGVDNAEALGLTLTYMLSPKLGVGVLAATPFEHDLKANGLGVNAGDTKHLPPTVTLQYFPMGSSSALQPYVGIGFNYTVFFSEDVDKDLESVIGGRGDLDLDDSFGFAAQIGLDYALDNNWVLNASVWYLDIDTEAEFKFDNGARVEADVDIDPWVYMLGVGYKF